MSGRTKQKLKDWEAGTGLVVTINNPSTMHISGLAGFDFVLIGLQYFQIVIGTLRKRTRIFDLQHIAALQLHF